MGLRCCGMRKGVDRYLPDHAGTQQAELRAYSRRQDVAFGQDQKQQSHLTNAHVVTPDKKGGGGVDKEMLVTVDTCIDRLGQTAAGSEQLNFKVIFPSQECSNKPHDSAGSGSSPFISLPGKPGPHIDTTRDTKWPGETASEPGNQYTETPQGLGGAGMFILPERLHSDPHVDTLKEPGDPGPSSHVLPLLEPMDTGSVVSMPLEVGQRVVRLLNDGGQEHGVVHLIFEADDMTLMAAVQMDTPLEGADDEQERYHVVPVGTLIRERSFKGKSRNQPAYFLQDSYNPTKENVTEEHIFLEEDIPVVLNPEAFECPICMDYIPNGAGITIRECLHEFCLECLSSHIKLGQDAHVQCPFMGSDGATCVSLLQPREIQALLTEDEFERFLSRGLSIAESQAANSFHCKTPNCPGWCLVEEGAYSYRCNHCHQRNCLNCQAIHQGLNCDEYQEELDMQFPLQKGGGSRKNSIRLKKMIKSGKAMHCPGCKIVISRNDGCDWLKCPLCKIEICWVTKGPRWGSKGKGDTSGGCKCKPQKKCHPNCRNCH